MTRMRLFYLLTFATGLLTGTAQAQDIAIPASLKEKGELRVGVKCDSPPAGFLDEKGNQAGIDIDMARYMADHAFGNPNKAVFTCVTAATRVQMLASGKVDVLFATMGVTEERKKTVDFATSTNWGSSGILVRAGEEVKSLDELKGKTLLTNKGAWQVTFLEKNHPVRMTVFRIFEVCASYESSVLKSPPSPSRKTLPLEFRPNLSMPKLLILFTSIFLYSNCSTALKSDDSALHAAVSDFNNGDLLSCEAKLKDYTSKYPEDYDGWTFLGTVALELEHDSLANVVFNKAITLNPKDVKALTGLGELARKDKDYDKAAEFYDKAISIDPTYGKAYASLLLIELKRGNYQTAVDLGEKASNLVSIDLDIKGNLSVFLPAKTLRSKSLRVAILYGRDGLDLSANVL